jgi:hypothetical protein
VNGFSDTVTLSASSSSPIGLSCSLSTLTIQGSGTSTLSCTASNLLCNRFWNCNPTRRLVVPR